MNYLILCVFLVTSCSSWKQKDFEKSLDKPAPESKVEVSEKDQKILEKFEVNDTPAVAKVTPPAEVKKTKVATAKPLESKKVDLKKSAPAVAKKETIVPQPLVKALPNKYPEDLIAVNEKAKKVWDLYKPNHHVNQKAYLDIHYLGMTVGKIMVMNKGRQMMNGKEVWHFHSRFKSAPFYSNIYELDDMVDTYVTTDGFLSAKYSLIQRESKQSIDDLQLYDRDLLKTFWFYKKKNSDGKIKNKDVKKFIPYYSIDPFSVVFFYQGLPLKDNDHYEIPIVNKGKILILNSLVEGREVIETELGKKKAIRVHASTNYTGETLKSGDLYFWFSDDAERKLLKAKAKIKIGSVTADIVKGE